MKALGAGLQAHLDSGTTTLSWCWRVTRKDGAVYGKGATGYGVRLLDRYIAENHEG